MTPFRIARFFLAAVFAFTSAGANATVTSGQPIAGIWQGVLKLPDRSVRRLLEITCKNGGKPCTATIYSVDENDEPIEVKNVLVRGRSLRLAIDMNSSEWPQYRRSYTAAMTDDGKNLRGKWGSDGGPSYPLVFERVAARDAWAHPAPKVQFISVQPAVKLETLDWGGEGRPIVLLTGLGNTAHIFYHFAQQLKLHYHVYAITRRGFGRSSKPAPTDQNYGADRLGMDVVAVIHSLKLIRPVLIGHSIAGEEMSAVARSHGEDVSGLVYLDAAYPYAVYDAVSGDVEVDSAVLRRKLSQVALTDPERQKQLVDELLSSDLPQLEHSLKHLQDQLQAVPTPAPGAVPPLPAMPAAAVAIVDGEQRFSGPMRLPALAMFASPHQPLHMYADEKANAAADAQFQAFTVEQIVAFRRLAPAAKVVEIPHADHYVFLTNESEVLRNIKDFIDTLH